MKKVTALILGVTLLGMGLAFAGQMPPTTQTTQTTVPASTQPIIVGNKHCPVSGDAVGQTPVTYEYNGKVYNLCCSGCIKAFKNDPEKYSKIAEADAKIVK